MKLAGARSGSLSNPGLAVVGVPSSAGARFVGQDEGPRALRQAGLVQKLTQARVGVTDFGDLPTVQYRPDPRHPRQQNLPLVVAVVRQVASVISEVLRSDLLPLVIGGDCTITLGVVAAASSYPELSLVYFDGDLDHRTPDNTVSGCLEGMGPAHLLGRGLDELIEISNQRPLLRPEQLIPFGYEDTSLEADEQAFLAGGVRGFPASGVAADPDASVAAALALISAEGSFLVHLDVDVVNHLDLPVADVPHFAGLPLDIVSGCLRAFARDPRFRGLVVTEFNARHDPDGSYAERLVSVIVAALAET